MKSAIIDWLVPLGKPLIPPISPNIKIDRGFNHEVTGALLCPAGTDWSDTEQVKASSSFESFTNTCNHRIKQKLRSGELSVAGDQWPIFLYSSYRYDESDPWKGLLQSSILVKVSSIFYFMVIDCTS